MATKRLKRPRDPIQLGKLIVDIATGQIQDAIDDRRDPSAVELGRRGGQKGGRSRAQKMTAEQRKRAAKKAALARWGKKTSTKSAD
jgi:hypothetical protein